MKYFENSPFKKPKKRYYLGKVLYGAPYFYPSKWNGDIISLRRLKLTSKEELESKNEQYPHLKNTDRLKYTNLPMVRRCKDWIFQLFGNHYWLQIGYPIKFKSLKLGWKDKFDSPRHEWNPAFYIFFFKWQFCIWWGTPLNDGIDDSYWEQVIWWWYYSDKDIKKAEETWGWTNVATKQSTWNKNYLK